MNIESRIKQNIREKLDNAAHKVIHELDVRLSMADEAIAEGNEKQLTAHVILLTGFLDCLESQGVIEYEDKDGLINWLWAKMEEARRA